MADRFGLFDTILDTIKSVSDRISARVDAIERREAPVGRDGLPGRDGATGPAGERGLTGEKGFDGAPGLDGETGKTGPEGPMGPKGETGATGPAGPQGEKGVSGDRGEKGLDGQDGANGLDGFGFDDMSVTYDGERQFVWTFTKGERSKVFTFDVPAVIYKGVFSPTTHYSTGDQVTYAASQWIARGPSVGVNPDEHIPESKRLWTLSSKRGERGRTGEKGADGKPGPRGDKGDRGPDRW